MLYKFKSKAAGDLIMLEANGNRVLQIIGKEPAAQGIIEVAQMPSAVAALRAAIAQEEQDLKAAELDATAHGAKAPAPQSIGLRQRALPLIDMLERCAKAGQDMVWGV